jgi:hypothetical protein
MVLVRVFDFIYFIYIYVMCSAMVGTVDIGHNLKSGGATIYI